MREPLGYWHRFWRELVCWLFGHRVTLSRQRHTPYYGWEEKDVPYTYRRGLGNYMWEDVAWWRAKCHRCRVRWRMNDEGRIVWHQRWWWALYGAISTARFHAKQLNDGNPAAFGWRFLVIPVAAAEQFALHFYERIPATWWTPLSDVQYWLYCRMDEADAESPPPPSDKAAVPHPSAPDAA